MKIWSLTNYHNLNNDSNNYYLSTVERKIFDCKEEKEGIIDLITYSGNMGKGDVVTSSNRDIKWKSVVPGSIGEEVWKITCNKKKLNDAVLDDSTKHEWALVNENNFFNIFVDNLQTAKNKTQTIKFTNNSKLSQHWVLFDYKTKQDNYPYALSIKSHVQINCSNKKLQIIGRASYSGNMGDDNILYSDSDKLSDWLPIEIDGKIISSYNQLCQFKGS